MEQNQSFSTASSTVEGATSPNTTTAPAVFNAEEYKPLVSRMFQARIKTPSVNLDTFRPADFKGTDEDWDSLTVDAEVEYQKARKNAFSEISTLVGSSKTLGYGWKDGVWSAKNLPSELKSAIASKVLIQFPNSYSSMAAFRQCWNASSVEELGEMIATNVGLQMQTKEERARAWSGLSESERISMAKSIQEQYNVKNPVVPSDGENARIIVDYYTEAGQKFYEASLSACADDEETKVSFALSLMSDGKRTETLKNIVNAKGIDVAARVAESAYALKAYHDGNIFGVFASSTLEGIKEGIGAVGTVFTESGDNPERDLFSAINKYYISQGKPAPTVEQIQNLSEREFAAMAEKIGLFSHKFLSYNELAHLGENDFEFTGVINSLKNTFAEGYNQFAGKFAEAKGKEVAGKKFTDGSWMRYADMAGRSLGYMGPIVASGFIPVVGPGAAIGIGFAQGYDEFVDEIYANGDVTMTNEEVALGGSLYGAFYAGTNFFGGKVATYGLDYVKGIVGRSAAKSVVDFNKRGVFQFVKDSINLDSKMFLAKWADGIAMRASAYAARALIREGSIAVGEGIQEASEDLARWAIAKSVSEYARDYKGNDYLQEKDIVDSMLESFKHGFILSGVQRGVFGGTREVLSGFGGTRSALNGEEILGGNNMFTATRDKLFSYVAYEQAFKARGEGFAERKGLFQLNKLANDFISGDEKARTELRNGDAYGKLTTEQKERLETLAHVRDNLSGKDQEDIDDAIKGRDFGGANIRYTEQGYRAGQRLIKAKYELLYRLETKALLSDGLERAKKELVGLENGSSEAKAIELAIVQMEGELKRADERVSRLRKIIVGARKVLKGRSERESYKAPTNVNKIKDDVSKIYRSAVGRGNSEQQELAQYLADKLGFELEQEEKSPEAETESPNPNESNPAETESGTPTGETVESLLDAETEEKPVEKSEENKHIPETPLKNEGKSTDEKSVSNKLDEFVESIKDFIKSKVDINEDVLRKKAEKLNINVPEENSSLFFKTFLFTALFDGKLNALMKLEGGIDFYNSIVDSIYTIYYLKQIEATSRVPVVDGLGYSIDSAIEYAVEYWEKLGAITHDLALANDDGIDVQNILLHFADGNGDTLKLYFGAYATLQTFYNEDFGEWWNGTIAEDIPFVASAISHNAKMPDGVSINDAISGFVRDIQEGDPWTMAVFNGYLMNRRNIYDTTQEFNFEEPSIIPEEAKLSKSEMLPMPKNETDMGAIKEVAGEVILIPEAEKVLENANPDVNPLVNEAVEEAIEAVTGEIPTEAIVNAVVNESINQIKDTNDNRRNKATIESNIRQGERDDAEPENRGRNKVSPGSGVSVSIPNGVRESGGAFREEQELGEVSGGGVLENGNDDIRVLPSSDSEPVNESVGSQGNGDGVGESGYRAAISSGRSNESESDNGEDVRPNVRVDNGQGLGNRGRTVSGEQLVQQNFSFGDSHLELPSGEVARIEANIRAIEIVKACEADERQATEEEKIALTKWVGWGGLSDVFDYYNSHKNQKSFERYNKLKNLLTPEEYEAAKKSTLNAHYTSEEIIRTMWNGVQMLGFRGGKVLEPAVGVGSFFGFMPKPIALNSSLFGFELDSITAKIAQLLYPGADIQAAGYETKYSPKSKDLVITNVPFAQTAPYDKRLSKILKKSFGSEGLNLHNYFIAKSVLELREGGLGMFITTHNTMDAVKARRFRQWLVSPQKDGKVETGANADIVACVRLPKTAFSKNAGTEVVTDIIIVRKRIGNEASLFAENNNHFANVSSFGSEEYQGKDVEFIANDYYKLHPEHLLGKFKLGGLYRGDELTVVEKSGQDTNNELSKIMDGLPNVFTGTVNQNSVTIGTGESKKTYGEEQIFKDYSELKQALVELSNDEATLDEVDEGKRKKLNELYDSFVKKYGTFNGSRSKVRKRIQEVDDEWAVVFSLEEEDKNNGSTNKKYRKARGGIFEQRVNYPYHEPTTAGSLSEAIDISETARGKIDLEYVGSLLGKDATSAEAEMLDVGLAFRNPITGNIESREDYLSGDVVSKLEEATAAGEEYLTNVRELKKVQPERISIGDISFSMSSAWMPSSILLDFLKDTAGIRNWSVQYSKDLGMWVFGSTSASKGAWSIATPFSAAMLEAGLDVSVFDVAEAAIKRSKLVVYRTAGYDENGKEIRVPDPSMTEVANDFVLKMQQAFKNFVMNTGGVHSAVEDAYNVSCNRIRLREFKEPNFPKEKSLRSGEMVIHYPNASKAIDLRPHQIKAVQRCLRQNTLLAHQVGTGKTFTMATAAMEMKRLGFANKPMIVVQNATLEGFATDFMKLYPAARLLVPMNIKDAESRRRFVASISTGNWDCVVIPQSFIERIENDPNRVEDYINSRIEELEELKRNVGKKSALSNEIDKQIKAQKKKLEGSVKDKEKRKAKAKTRHESILDRERDKGIEFERLGVDALFVDEAHAYKKLQIQTTMARIKGIDTSASTRAMDLHLKTRYLDERGGRTVFATGTPITNTMAEIWTMMKFLNAELLKNCNIETFDQFAGTFGEIEKSFEENPASGMLEAVDRFKKYVNVPELQNIFRTIADVVLSRDVFSGKESDVLPKLKGGKRTDIILEQSETFSELNQVVVGVLDEYKTLDGKMKKEESAIPLTMFTTALKLSIDPRLVNPAFEDNPDSKTNRVVKEVYDRYKATESYKGTQMIFCDVMNSPDPKALDADLVDKNKRPHTSKRFFGADSSAPQFNLFEDIKAKLVKSGIPEEEIVIVRDQKDKKRAELFQSVREGKVRVLLGHTEKMGVGVNVQDLLCAIHHIDAPKRPMDFEQRNGRILRQGNLHAQWRKPVEIVTYSVKGSADAAQYQRLAMKANFINAIMSNAIKGREIVDEDEFGNNFEEAYAACTGNQDALKKLMMEKELRELTSRRDYLANMKSGTLSRLDVAKQNIEITKRNIAKHSPKVDAINKAIPYVSVESQSGRITWDYSPKSIVIDGQRVKDKIHAAVRDAIMAGRSSRDKASVFVDFGGGVEVEIPTRQEKFIVRINGEEAFSGKYSYGAPVGALRAVLGEMKNYRRYNESNAATLEDLNESVKSLESVSFEEFPEDKAKRIEELESELSELTKRIEAEQAVEMAKRGSRERVYFKVADVANEIINRGIPSELKELRDSLLAHIEYKTGIKIFRESSEQIRKSAEKEEAGRYKIENDRFNAELEAFKAGTHKGVLHLGVPGAILRASGLNATEITIEPKVLKEHLGKHDIAIDEIQNLPEALNNPLMVYEWGTKARSLIVITDLTLKDGRKITAAVKLERGGKRVEINEIASIHGKAAERFLEDMTTAKHGGLKDALRYVSDKKKALAWLGLVPPMGTATQSAQEPDLHGIIENFENPSIENNLRSLSSNGVIYGYFDPVRRELHLNEDFADFDTPIHEWTHVWWAWVSEQDSRLTDRIVDLVKRTKEFAKLKAEAEADAESVYHGLDDSALAQEVFSRFVGKRGEEFITKSEKGIWAKLKEYAQAFFKTVLRTLGLSDSQIESLTLEDVQNMALRDLFSDEVSLTIEDANKWKTVDKYRTLFKSVNDHAMNIDDAAAKWKSRMAELVSAQELFNKSWDDAQRTYAFEQANLRRLRGIASRKVAARIEAQARVRRGAFIDKSTNTKMFNWKVPALGSKDGGIVGWSKKAEAAIRKRFEGKEGIDESYILALFRKIAYPSFNGAAIKSLSAKDAMEMKSILNSLMAAPDMEAAIARAEEAEQLLAERSVEKVIEDKRKEVKAYLKKFGSRSMLKLIDDRKAQGMAEFYAAEVLTFSNLFKVKGRKNREAVEKKLQAAQDEFDGARSIEAALKARTTLQAAADLNGRCIEEMSEDELHGIMDKATTVIVAGEIALSDALKARAQAATDSFGGIVSAAKESAKGIQGREKQKTLRNFFRFGYSLRERLESVVGGASQGEREVANEQAKAIALELTECYHNEQAMIAEDSIKFERAILEAYGQPLGDNAEKRAEALIFGLNERKSGSEQFSKHGEKLTTGQLIAQWSMLQQREISGRLESLSEEEVESLTDKEKELYERWLKKDDLEKFLGEEVVAFANRVSAIMQARAQDIDAQSFKDVGMPLSYKGDGYFPIVRDKGFEVYMQDRIISNKAPVVPSILKPRSYTLEDIDERADVLSLFRRHTFEVAHYVSYGDAAAKFRILLKGKEPKLAGFMDSVAKINGTAFVSSLDKQIRDIVSGKMQGASLYQDEDWKGATNKFLGSLRWLTRMLALGGSVVSGARQASGGMFAFANHVGFGETFRALFGNAERSVALWSEIKESKGYNARYPNMMFDRALKGARAATSEGLSSKVNNKVMMYLCRAEQMSMFATNNGDKLPLMLVGTSLYGALKNKYYSMGMSEEAAKERALTEFWENVDKCQQAKDIQNKDSISRSDNELAKISLQFLTAPLQFATHMIHAIDVLAKTGFKDKDAWKRAATVAIHNHIVEPLAMLLVNWFVSLSDDDDDFEVDFAPFIMGSMDALPLVGGVSEIILRGRYNESVWSPAAFEYTTRLGNRARKVAKSLFDGEDDTTWAAVKKLARTASVVRQVQDVLPDSDDEK